MRMLGSEERYIIKIKKGKSKKTISASGVLGLLQRVSEPDIERCTNEDVEPRMRVDTRRCVNEDAGLRREIHYEILRRLERGTKPFL